MLWVSLGMTALITLAHYTTDSHDIAYHNVFRRLYYVPVVLAAFGWGLRGGLAVALVASLAYIPHAFLLEHHHDPAPAVDKILEIVLPHDKIILNHTPIYFEPERWLKLTRGFPFEVYLENVRKAVHNLPCKKRFKFIINHSLFVEEVQRFQERVEPNDTCEISLKLMNDQGNGLVVDTMQRTAHRVFDRLEDLDAVLENAGWANKPRPTTSADLVKHIVETGDVTECVYRNEPLELRLAFYKGTDNKQVLKYRYCPYFPPDFGHKFHLGRDDIEKMGKNWKKGPFRDHCDRCRLLHYRTPCGQEGTKQAASENQVEDVIA